MPGRTGGNQIKKLHRMVEKSDNLEWALTAGDAVKVYKKGKTGVIAGLEGAHILEKDPVHLEWFHDKGVRWLSKDEVRFSSSEQYTQTISQSAS